MLGSFKVNSVLASKDSARLETYCKKLRPMLAQIRVPQIIVQSLRAERDRSADHRLVLRVDLVQRSFDDHLCRGQVALGELFVVALLMLKIFPLV